MTLVPTALAVTALIAQAPQPPTQCQPIEPTAAQRQLEFRNAVAVGPFALRSLAGERSCQFEDNGLGQCRLRDPRMIHITFEGRHQWFTAPEGRSVRIDVADHAYTCTVVED